MSAPYKVMEFHAASGNHAMLKVYNFESMRPAGDVAWDDSPTNEDIHECDCWFRDAVKSLHPEIVVDLLSGIVEDDQERDAIIAGWIMRSNAGGN